MKLVFLSHDGNYNGGAQKCLVDLFKGLRLKYPTLQIYVIFPYEGDLIQACLPYIDGYRIIPMQWWLLPGQEKRSFKWKYKYVKRARKSVRNIIRYLKEIKPDYGITNTIVIPFLAVSCRLLSIRHDWFIHEVPVDTWNDNSFIFNIKTIQWWINILSRKIIVTSNYAKLYYLKSISDYKLVVIDQAVELEIPMSMCNNSHMRYTILLVGAFDSNKGQLELLNAVNYIVKNGRDIHCYLVGADFGLMDKCKEYVALNKLENNVSIVPFVTDVWRYYFQADVLIVSSALETFGRVTVEAQKCGLPVILSNVGANPERIMNEVNGLLYQKGNVSDLVDKIEILRDADTRKLYSSNNALLDLGRYNVLDFAANFMKTLC